MSSGEQILIVEDKSVDRVLIRRYLTDLGYPEPLEAASGEEALEKTATTKPDLVLMDIDLPGDIDGIDAARRIRSTLDIPTIFITALTDPSAISRACQAQPVGYLVKPINKLSLLGCIQVGLEQQKLITELRTALRQVKVLSGLLPICSYCKKIRNEEGHWERLERYISTRSDSSFSHGICPDCMQKYIREMDDELQDQP